MWRLMIIYDAFCQQWHVRIQFCVVVLKEFVVFFLLYPSYLFLVAPKLKIAIALDFLSSLLIMFGICQIKISWMFGIQKFLFFVHEISNFQHISKSWAFFHENLTKQCYIHLLTFSKKLFHFKCSYHFNDVY